MTSFAHVTIVGAGAMGCFFAARLREAGTAITLVDTDTARLAAIQANGVTLEDDGGPRTVAVAACPAAQAGPTDLVMLFTKGMHSAAAIKSVAHLAADGTCAITLQNGLGNAEAMAEVFSRDRILMGVTDWPADFSPPATVSSHGAGRIWLGAMAAGPAGPVEAALRLFDAAGLPAKRDDHVEVQIWEKVAFNAALNALAAVTRVRVGGLDCPPGREIAFAILDEVAATAAARGLLLDSRRLTSKVEHALAHHRQHKASMLQDIEAGRRTEIEAINGAVIRAAEAHGVPTPVTRTLANLVRMIEARSPS